jgi:retinol-binding protein 3
MSPLSLRKAEAAGASQRLKELFVMTTRRFVILAIVGWAVMATLSSVHARQTPNGPDGAIDGATRRQVIDGAIERLKTAYVFPEVAEKMAVALRERLDRKEYDGITSARTFVETLTRNLQEVSQDKHLRVLYSADPFPARPDAPSPEERARGLAEERRRNFGFERVERLEGNIGYIDLRGFSGSPEAGETAVAAMNLLSGTDALIFDLRRNGGGSPAMIGLISSYLFDDVVHLNDFYWRESNETRQFWTSPHVAGQRYGGTKPVFVLTSARTFSAAEEFTYNLKNLKRATIVGETTGGGAHPGGVRRITDHFGIWVPAGRAINPITKTNWEGTGIEPDIKVDAPQALQSAHLEALKKVRETTTDARYREQLDRAIAAVQKSSSSESPR